MPVAMLPPPEDVDLVLLDLVVLDALVVLPDVVAAIDVLVVLEDHLVLAVPPVALVLPAVVVDQTAVKDLLAQHNVVVLSVLLKDVVQEAKILQEMSKWILYKIYFTSNIYTPPTKISNNAHLSNTCSKPKQTSQLSPKNDVELYNFFFQIKK